MALIGTLVNFIAGTKIVVADVNSNFAAIRNAFNGSAVLNDTANTIAVAHTFTISQNLNAGFTTTTGTATFGAGVTFASGTTITLSGATLLGITQLVVGTDPGGGDTVRVGGSLRLKVDNTNLTLQSVATNSAESVRFIRGAASGFYNFLLGNAWTTNDALEIIPSTAADGSTFTTPIAKFLRTGVTQLSGNVSCAAALNVAGVATFSGGVVGVPGVVYQAVSMSTSSTSPVNVTSFAIPANTLTATGNLLRIYVAGITTGTGTGTASVAVSGSTVGDVANAVGSALAFHSVITIQRLTSTTGTAMTARQNGTEGAVTAEAAANHDWTTSATVAISAQVSTTTATLTIREVSVEVVK